MRKAKSNALFLLPILGRRTFMRSETMTMNQFMTDMRRDLEDRLQDYDSMKGQLIGHMRNSS